MMEVMVLEDFVVHAVLMLMAQTKSCYKTEFILILVKLVEKYLREKIQYVKEENTRVMIFNEQSDIIFDSSKNPNMLSKTHIKQSVITALNGKEVS